MSNNEANTENDGLSSLYNDCLRRLRERSRFRLVTGSPLIEIHNITQADSDPENSVLVRQIRDAMESLPNRQRIILELRDFQDAKYDDIAKMLGMSVPAVRASVNRSRKWVAGRISENPD